MRDKKIGDKALLKSMLDNINKIEQYKALGITSDAIFDAVLFNLITIGEAASQLSKHTKESYPDVPWGEIIGHRNVLIHNYLGINAEIVSNVVDNHLPPLKKHIETIVGELK